MGYHGMSEDDVKEIMRRPSRLSLLLAACRRLNEGMPHPRGYGNNARVLGRYVVKLRLLRSKTQCVR